MEFEGQGSIGAEKFFFAVKVGFFCLCFRVCSCFWMALWVLFTGVLMVLSMLVCVTFNVGMRGV